MNKVRFAVKNLIVLISLASAVYAQFTQTAFSQTAKEDEQEIRRSMVEIEPDKTGRITIPANLREYAGLDRDVVVVGVDTRFEIWDSATWDAYVAEQEASYADMESEGMPTLS